MMNGTQEDGYYAFLDIAIWCIFQEPAEIAIQTHRNFKPGKVYTQS